MSTRSSKSKKINYSDPESIEEISDLESKPTCFKRSPLKEITSNLSSTTSSRPQRSKKKLIKYVDDESDLVKKSRKAIKDEDFSEVEILSDEEENESKPKTSKNATKSSRRKNKKRYNDDDDEEDEEDKKRKKQKNSEVPIERPARERNRATDKKDDWIDDESHDSASSCELDSDEEKRSTKSIKISDEEILDFFNKSTADDIQSLFNISDLRVEKLISLKPFDNIDDLHSKFQSNLLTYALASAKESLRARHIVNDLFEKCQKCSQKIKSYVKRITNPDLTDEQATKLAVKKQPKILNKKMKLKPYQLTGLNWLCFMHEENLNAVLADEMGLGKTCQTIAFLAYLHEINERFMHLIVVPSSTLENWSREISNWFPGFNFVIYNGSPDERREIRQDVLSWRKRRSGPPLNAILTTYSYVSSNEHDKAFFRSLKLEYCVFDEAHCFKNMKTVKYENLIKIKSRRKLLLTGTPLQNNIVELMSLLYFVTPSTFLNKQNYINRVFLLRQNQKESDAFYTEKIVQARGIMEPFVLRRLKVDVLKELPEKKDEILVCDMTASQEVQYTSLVDFYKKRREQMELKDKKIGGLFDALMELRKVANHPLLVRNLYTDEKIKEMAHIIVNQSDPDTRYDYVVEDMSIMNDFELHKMCPLYKGLRSYQLSTEDILNCGKFNKLKELLDEFKKAGDQVLLFSQFKIVLDIIEEFFNWHGYTFLRLDGTTKVEDRQGLIDKFNNDKRILVFMLTTKAGGVGINLTSANRVVLYDIDYNPHNDKQAEARCHRLGQQKDVQTYRLILKNSIDETMLKIQAKKLELDADIHGENQESKSRLQTMKMLKDVFN